MRMLVLAPKEGKIIKMAVRAAMLHRFLEKNGVELVTLPDFNIRYFSWEMLSNYVKLLRFRLTKKKSDVVLFENERSDSLLAFFERLGFRLALDIRDNRAVQRSAYQVDDGDAMVKEIEQTLMANIKRCEHVFVVSEECRELYDKKYHKKMTIIENASDPSFFVPQPYPQEKRVGFISGISPGRGIEFLIEAMEIVRQEVPDALLSVAGTPTGKTEVYYQELKRKYNHTWLSFHDDVFYSTNAKDFIASSALMVIPHPDHLHYHTTLPVKLFDALAVARPLVVTRCASSVKVLEKYHCGLSAGFSPEEFAQPVIRLLKNREEAIMMGQNGRRAVEEYYNWDMMAKKMIRTLFGASVSSEG